MTEPSVEKKPFSQKVSFWITAVAVVVGAGLGVAGGWAQQPPNDGVLLEPAGDDCPQVDNITSRLTTTVSEDRSSLVIASDLHLTLTGVVPPKPSLYENLEQPNVENSFATCYLPTAAEIKSITWADGKIESDFNLIAEDVNNGYYINSVAKPELHPDHSTLTVDLCAPRPDGWISPLCRPNANNSIVVRTKAPIENILSAPFPGSVQTQDDYVEATWQFQGAVPPLTVTLDVPFNAMATSWLWWANGRSYEPFLDASALGALAKAVAARVDLQYVTQASAFWLALVVAAWILRRRSTDSGQTTGVSARLLLVGLAGVLLSFEIYRVGSLPPSLAMGFIPIAAWAVISAAVAPKPLLPAIAVLASAAFAMLWVLAAQQPGQRSYDLVIIAFCVSFVLLVMTGAWAIWRQIANIFAMTRPEEPQPKWQVLYRNIVYRIVVATFMIAIGFPVGKELNHGGYETDRFEALAAMLINSYGIWFRDVFSWIMLLLIVSFLAAYILRFSERPFGPTLTSVLALTLCLGALWTDRVAIVVITAIPVWLLQFAALYLAFRRLAEAADDSDAQPVTSVPPPAGMIPPGGNSHTATAQATAVDRLPGLRSQHDRLAQAKIAGQISAVMAIVPVGYLIWTTLAQIGDRLSTNTGILIVALLAVLELVRWVVTGFVFGYLYTALPGRIGPVKALSYSAIYIVSCVPPLVLAQGFGNDLIKETAYRGAQFALFAIVLAVLIDYLAEKSDGGSWQDLQQDYDLQGYAKVATVLAPAALLIIGVGAQIVEGSGVEVANTLLSGITSVLRPF